MKLAMMIISLWLLSLIAAGHATAADECSPKVDGQRRIDACTRVIDNSRITSEARAVAYFNRGLAFFEDLGNSEAALNDFSKAAKLNSGGRVGVLALCFRASANAQLKQYDEAIGDSDTCLDAIVSKPNDLKGIADTTKLADAAKRARGLAQQAGLEQRWVEYLADIQRNGDYPNWSDCPYDLYFKAHRDPEMRAQDTPVDKVACLQPASADGFQLSALSPHLLVPAIVLALLAAGYWVRRWRIATSTHPTVLDPHENASVSTQRTRGPTILAIILMVLSP